MPIRSVRRLSRSTLETLEQRIVPAVTIQAGVDLDGDGANDDLRIIGGNEATIVRISDDGLGPASLLLDVDKNGDGDFTDAGELENFVINLADDSCIIDLQLGGGNDQVGYELTDDLFGSIRHLSIDLGSGNDVLQINLSGHDVLFNSLLLVDVLAGAGNDQLGMIHGDISDSEIVLDAILGAGNDTLSAGASSPVNLSANAVLQTTVDLGTGTNIASLFFGYNVGTSSTASVDFDLIGGSGIDTIQAFAAFDIGNGTAASSVNLDFELGAGNDLLLLSLQKLDVETNSSFDVRGSGGAGNDQIQMGVTGSTPSHLKGVAQFDLLGGLGNDELTAFFVADPPNTLELDGQLRVNLLGQEGNDRIISALATLATSTGNFSLVVMGGAGADNVTAGVNLNAAPITLGRTGRMIVNGGNGLDSLLINGGSVSLFDVRLFETIA